MEMTVVLQKLLNSKAKIKVLQGGGRSSKTWSIIKEQLLIFQANKGLKLTITRENLTWLKDTVLLDWGEILEKYKIPIYPNINPGRPDQTYNVIGNNISFIGTEEEGKLFGRKQDYFWINEALYKVKEKVLDNLEMRTDIGGWVDYNPTTTEHWVYKLEKRKDCEFIYSTVLDNPFASETIVKKILGYESTEENIRNGTANEYNWQVYGLGKRADIKGLVFKDWTEYDKITDRVEWTIYGLDFGFTNSPTTLIKVSKKGSEVYCEELLYETNLTNADIGNKFSQLGLKKRYDEIIADSAEPKSITEIYQMGWNIKGAIKGADSVLYGIQLMQQYKLLINNLSKNLQKELRNYKFADDREGKPTNNPIDEWNHCIDAIRYVFLNILGKKRRQLAMA